MEQTGMRANSIGRETDGRTDGVEDP